MIMTSPNVRKAQRAIARGLGFLTVAMVLIGLAHTKPARPLMAMVGKSLGMHTAGGCPLGYDKKATPEERTAGIRQFANSHRGAEAAKARPALGFDLDHATLAEVEAWAKDRGISCTGNSRSGHDLECKDVPSQVVDGVETVALTTMWLDFDSSGRLESVMTMRRNPNAAAVESAFEVARKNLDTNAGAPSTVGEGNPEKLSSAALYQASAEYRFNNYYAVVRATNVGGGTYMLTEEYRSLVD
jgi:hypothetical protein